MSEFKFVISALMFGALALASGTTSAQERDHLEVVTTVQKEITVETDDGNQETRLVAAESVVPGERVVYTIKFRNVGQEPMSLVQPPVQISKWNFLLTVVSRLRAPSNYVLWTTELNVLQQPSITRMSVGSCSPNSQSAAKGKRNSPPFLSS